MAEAADVVYIHPFFFGSKQNSLDEGQHHSAEVVVLDNMVTGDGPWRARAVMLSSAALRTVELCWRARNGGHRLQPFRKRIADCFIILSEDDVGEFFSRRGMVATNRYHNAVLICRSHRARCVLSERREVTRRSVFLLSFVYVLFWRVIES